METLNIDPKQEKYELTITADGVVSTDACFTMNNLTLDSFRIIIGNEIFYEC